MFGFVCSLLLVGCAHGFSFGTTSFSRRRPVQMQMLDASSISDSLQHSYSTLPLIGIGLGGMTYAFSYYKVALATAGIISGIKPNQDVVELDCLDGKNVFYLPAGTDYTAVMGEGVGDSKKRAEKRRVNEQLILECVGKANGANVPGSALTRGKVRTLSQELPARSADVVLSIGALERSVSADRGLVVNEALRVLRAGGLFLFVERGGEDTISLVQSFFPREVRIPVRAKSRGGKAERSKHDGGGKGKGNIKGKGRRGQSSDLLSQQDRDSLSVVETELDEEEKAPQSDSDESSKGIASGDGGATSGSENGGVRMVDAIFSQKLELPFGSYVVGIATKQTSS